MCGRAAQTQNAVFAAAMNLGVQHTHHKTTTSTTNFKEQAPPADSDGDNDDNVAESKTYEWGDNYNMSPGMGAMVFFKQKDSGGVVTTMEEKVWGLLSRGGTTKNPLPANSSSRMNLHFQSQMYNARSDTLFSKTFARLANKGQSCLVALDGFFEWKEPALKGGKRQPYFIHRKQSKDTLPQKPYLLMAGLWNSVPTGRSDEPLLQLFSIVTTEACQPFAWLHHRMPLLIWDDQLAQEWLDRPTEATLRKLETHAAQTPESVLAWHPVTTEMSSIKFRSDTAIHPLPKTKTIQSFFAAAAKAKPTDNDNKTTMQSLHSVSSKTALKRPAESAAPSQKQKKKKTPISTTKKKGSLDSFFSPKKK